MKPYPTIKSKTYAVSSAIDCEVQTADGQILVSVTANKQAHFVGFGGTVYITDDDALITDFKGAFAGSASGEGEADLSNYVTHAELEVASNMQYTALTNLWLEHGKMHVMSTGLNDELLALRVINTPSGCVGYAELVVPVAAYAEDYFLVWPEDLIWIEGAAEGAAPSILPGRTYHFVMRQLPDGSKYINLAYSHDTITI